MTLFHFIHVHTHTQCDGWKITHKSTVSQENSILMLESSLYTYLFHSISVLCVHNHVCDSMEVYRRRRERERKGTHTHIHISNTNKSARPLLHGIYLLWPNVHILLIKSNLHRFSENKNGFFIHLARQNWLNQCEKMCVHATHEPHEKRANHLSQPTSNLSYFRVIRIRIGFVISISNQNLRLSIEKKSWTK